jgi:hypothetical protein
MPPTSVQCGYCGKGNESLQAACFECGTALQTNSQDRSFLQLARTLAGFSPFLMVGWCGILLIGLRWFPTLGFLMLLGSPLVLVVGIWMSWKYNRNAITGWLFWLAVPILVFFTVVIGVLLVIEGFGPP